MQDHDFQIQRLAATWPALSPSLGARVVFHGRFSPFKAVGFSSGPAADRSAGGRGFSFNGGAATGKQGLDSFQDVLRCDAQDRNLGSVLGMTRAAASIVRSA